MKKYKNQAVVVYKIIVMLVLSVLIGDNLHAQAAKPTVIPTRKPIVQVNLYTNEVYYLDALQADIERLEKGLARISGKEFTIPQKDRVAMLVSIIDNMLFKQYCEKRNIRVSDSDVTSRINQVKASMGPRASDEAVEATLLQQGIFVDAKAFFKNELLFSSYMAAEKASEVKTASVIKVEDIVASYEEMKFNLRRPEVLKGTMLFAATAGLGPAEKKKISDAMKVVANQVKANPAKFEEFLIRGIIDSKAAGYVTLLNFPLAKTNESKNQFPAIYDAAFKLKPGEISGLVEDERGLGIIRYGSLLPSKQLNYEDTIEGVQMQQALYLSQKNPATTVLEFITYELTNSRQQKVLKTAQSDLYGKLRKEAFVTILQVNLKPLFSEADLAPIKALADAGNYNINFK